MNRRDLLLEEMGITQWQLTKPQVLKGEAQICLDNRIKLVIVCQERHHTTQLFQDILLTLNMQKEQYQWFDFAQAKRLVFQHQPIFWLIGNTEQTVAFAHKNANLPIWQNESWHQLAFVATKRQFWQQIAPFANG
ncbi:DNA polymerase III subunit psi [[Haemophilus] ducreyi]|uniref:DNA polymerase III subunit psi n=1 Tax=Haemophilus ducreyi TaxID=730 RepID=UPI00065507D1|nr:DNA polymerase III subunit psi [[Haemophilus] ducreyi]AKO44849.1 DNA polymerase III subunit psi [[Haemophilus] ducreyi]AKO46254.1 DNA polymerase III subunit psi [[Haemophilus] ducreyi]AKO47597.1 DNA polymerase III subunit psi [[Haemophilus] ducreyi]AKO48979.1 DNA polymerase III subunit psi [[Haemophilus] ducreyi]ANF61836.1 DNA polymerase III subunit psi [[Haemophilus] ducreyi]